MGNTYSPIKPTIDYSFPSNTCQDTSLNTNPMYPNACAARNIRRKNPNITHRQAIEMVKKNGCDTYLDIRKNKY